MKTVHWLLDRGLGGNDIEGCFDVADDAKTSEIEARVEKEIRAYVAWGWVCGQRGAVPPPITPKFTRPPLSSRCIIRSKPKP